MGARVPTLLPRKRPPGLFFALEWFMKKKLPPAKAKAGPEFVGPPGKEPANFKKDDKKFVPFTKGKKK